MTGSCRTLWFACALAASAAVGCNAQEAARPTVRANASEPAMALPADASTSSAFDAAVAPSSEEEALAFALAGFNLQSSDADEGVLVEQLKSTASAHLWGLAEVNASSGPALEAAFEAATGHDYGHVMGSTGGRQYRLLIAFDTERFQLVAERELTQIGGRSGRAPLFLELLDRRSEQHLLFMVNHLQRGDDGLRARQAQQLHDWARQQVLPIIAVGDYNFDWSLATGDEDHDTGYDILTAGGVFSWVRPRSLFPTQCSGFQSVLDFVFVAQAARKWRGEARVLDTERPCVDTPDRSDHRPVWASFVPSR